MNEQRPVTGQCEVLVVGAGPTGLTMANLLARSGVKVRLVEKRKEATRESRAFAVQARTLELLQAMGIADALIARGIETPSVNIHVDGKFAGGLDFTRAESGDTPFPYILMVPQSETEDVLGADLERLGMTIERDLELVGYEMNSAGVSAQLQKGDGSRETVDCAYIVGADGSRSIVREQAGIAWDGELLPQRFLLADCKVEWPFDHQNFRVFLHGQLIGLFMPLDGAQCSRVMATDVSGGFGAEDGSKPAPLDLKEMQEGMAAALQVPIKLSDPVWVTRYRAHHRKVDTYGKGRAFVAGDAAHIHSPAGGQGMNTGMQDAANLVWKLAAVLRGADSALLDSYNGERLPVGEAVVKRTGKLFAAAAGQAGFKARIRDTIVPLVLPIISKNSGFQTKAFDNISQRVIAYPADGSLVPEDNLGGSGPTPGMRAPDAALPSGGTLFDRLSGYRFTLLALSLDKADEAGLASLHASREALAAIAPDTHVATIDMIAPQSDLAERYGLSGERRQMTYLVRPDGYIASRDEGLGTDRGDAWLANLMKTLTTAN